MAKQRGVLQLSGRVDNLCYYQQKGVRGGLVRRVNLAMSERVKAGAEYTNLRTANSFFGACSMLAAAILSLINQRSLYMTRADRQSYLTARILKLCHEIGLTGTTSDIPIGSLSTTGLVIAFNSIMKVNPREFFVSLPLVETEVPIGATIVREIPAIELERYMSYFGGVEVRVNFYYKCSVGDTYRDRITGKFSAPVAESTINRSSISWRPGDVDLELHITAGINEDIYNCYIIVFDVVRAFIADRPLLINSARTAHMVGIQFY